MKEVEKVVRNGKVAVLYSPGWGAGWSTWNGYEEILLFHPRLVEAVEKGQHSESQMNSILRDLLGDVALYVGGADDLKIRWIDQGSRFLVDEHDGSESIQVLGPDSGFIA